MPGAGSNKRFYKVFGTVNGDQVKVSIIDKNYSGSVMPFKIDQSGGGFELAYNTNDQDPHQRIDTMTCNITIVNNNSDVQDFFEDLIDAEEGRFFIQVQNSVDQVIFIGKVVADEMTLEERPDPPIKLVAICATTDLKNIDYDHDYLGRSIKDIILYCLNKLDSASLYSNSEAILMTQSNIAGDTPYSLASPFASIYVQNYFHTIENEKKKPLKCWDVINELCGRLYCKFAYEHGRWNFTGMEGMWETRTGSYLFYAKNGSTISGTSPSNSLVDINDYALFGGQFRYQAGINQVLLKINKEWTNRVYGDGDFHDINYPGAAHADYEVGYLIKGEAYTFRFFNNIIFADGLDPKPYNFRVKFTVKIKDLVTNTTVTSYYEFEYPFNTAIYDYKYDIAAQTNDSTLTTSAQIIEVNPSGSNVEALTCRINYKLTKNKETETTEFKAYLDNKNVKIKTINNLACDKYGKDVAKFYTWNGVAGDPRDLTEDWKLNSADSYSSLELAIVKHMLKYLRNIQEYYLVNLNKTTAFDISTSLYKYEYKGQTYRIMSWKRNVLSDFVNVNMIKVGTGSTTGIITVEDVPAVNGNTSNFSNTITDVSTVILEEFEGVTANNITLNYVIPSNSLQSSLKNNISVFVEGVRWKHVNTIGTKKNTYAVDPATNKITFFRALDGATVIVILNKIFVTGEAF